MRLAVIWSKHNPFWKSNVFIISLVGPLTVAGTRIIVGIVTTGIHCADPGRRVGIYQDVLKPVVQCFIAEIVPELDFLCQDMKWLL